MISSTEFLGQRYEKYTTLSVNVSSCPPFQTAATQESVAVNIFYHVESRRGSLMSSPNVSELLCHYADMKSLMSSQKTIVLD